MTAADLLSIDVEDPASSIRWAGGDAPVDRARLEQDAARTLDLLERHGARATFFVVGEVALAAPDVVREVLRRGHRVASHGMRHQPLARLDRARFRDDLLRSLDALASAGADRVRGFRAPWWSVPSEDHWALDALEEAGLAYDSSIFPARTSHYGNARAPLAPHRIAGRRLWEVPPTCVSVGPFRVPGPGGFFCRLYPTPVARGLLRRASVPRHLYFHSWEIAPAPAPASEATLAERLIHGLGRGGMARRVGALLAAGTFRPIEELEASLA